MTVARAAMTVARAGAGTSFLERCKGVAKQSCTMARARLGTAVAILQRDEAQVQGHLLEREARSTAGDRAVKRRDGVACRRVQAGSCN